MKRGQISIFIVLGVILLIMVGMLFYLQEQESDVLTVEITEKPSLFPVEKYITFCLEQATRESVSELALKGGTLNLSQDNSMNTKTGLAAIHFVPEIGNQLITIPQAEMELAAEIESKLDDCIQITEYERLEYKATEGEKDVSITLNYEDIYVELDYPLRLEKADEVVVEDYFNEFVDLPLGKFMEISNEITNAELQGPVDLDFIRLTNPQISIVKEKPYPNSVYYLETQNPKGTSSHLAFTFAVGKYDLTSLKFFRPDTLFKIDPQVDEGACYVNSMCFSNTEEVNCQMAGGEFESGRICPVEIERVTSELINSSYGESCDSWFDLYTGEVISETKMHGESWCSNDPGVGGRYYKLSCVDGRVIPESCSDYRDELCAEKTTEEGFSTATCRPNRFWSCQTCDSEECCTNGEQRDCTWDSAIGCFPTSQPGMKFWNVDLSTQICSSGATTELSDTFNFYHTQAASCYSVGDCGSNINFIGDYTNLETVLTKNIIDEDFYTSLIAKQRATDNSYEGDFYSDQFIPESSFTPTPSFEFIEVLNSYLRNIDEMLVYDVDSILDPDVIIPLQSLEVAQCDPWKPVQTNRCSDCGSVSPFTGEVNYAACSEYRCKSLGPDCTFELRNGTGYCTSPYEDNIDLEVVSLIPEGYEFEEEESLLGKGIRITEDIALHKPLRLQLDTNKDALCKLSYLPDKDFTDLTGSDLSGQQYTGQHDIALTFNHDFDIFDRILEYFDKDSYASILDTIVDLRYKMESFKRQYPTVEKYSSGLYSLLVPIVNYYLDDQTQYKLEAIFNNLDAKNYFVFLKCQDLSGKETQDFYFRFVLDDPCQDEEPPEVVHHQATGSGELSIYVNEISSCSYDTNDVSFDEMRYDLSCERNPYAVTGIANGSYRCNADVSDLLATNDQLQLFVKCQDHPEFLAIDNLFEFVIFDDINYQYYNNQSGLNLSILTTENMIFTDLTSILELNEFGAYDVYVNKSFQKDMELLFERPMQCSEAGVDLACSSTRCILPIDQNMDDGLVVQCKERVPMCEFYWNNENEVSYEITYQQRIPLSIESTSYFEETFVVTYEDTGDAQTDCGIQLQKKDGYFAMKHVPNTNQFVFKRTDDRVGAFFADVICLNKYGDKAESRIQYS